MSFPLSTVLTAAPGLISAAAEIIRAIKDKKNPDKQPEQDRIEDLEDLLERQALIIEELALNNKNLVLAVKKNRILSISSMILGVAVLLIVIFR